jgi:hypothetical protein
MAEEPAHAETDLQAQAAKHADALAKTHRDGSGWFFWIAGLSLVNSAVILAGSEWSFLIGLGVTQFIDGIALAVADEAGVEGLSVISVIAFLLDLVVAGTFVMWGVLSRKKHLWAYVVGMVLYALDGLLFLLVGDIPSLGFHVFALFFIFKGFSACRQLKRLESLVSGLERTEGAQSTEGSPALDVDASGPSASASADPR